MIHTGYTKTSVEHIGADCGGAGARCLHAGENNKQQNKNNRGSGQYIHICTHKNKQNVGPVKQIRNGDGGGGRSMRVSGI
jgi:hypothetical protein